ncbi:MAG: hypothetical protein HZC41_09915 [Chloroflexi bacterium]|nr:hypothetical protein [Chloroflexota bacterium]
MDVATPPVNPYHPVPDDDLLPLLPFAGRQKAFERLYQQITDPVQARTTIFLGRQHVGKTAFFLHFHPFFEETYVGVYVPLGYTPLNHEADWLKALAQRTTAALVGRNFTLSRLPEIQPDQGSSRDWYETEYLPEALAAIRRYRRLVYLFDDVEHLLAAVADGRLPPDTFDFWHRLQEQHRQLSLALTMDAEREAEVARLAPLAAVTDSFRLTNLTAEESADLLRQPVAQLYTVSDEAAAVIFRATGGDPRLLQRFGQHLFRHYEAEPQRTTLTSEDVKAITPAIYRESEADLARRWETLPPNERLALRAIIGLLYADPLTPISPADIEAWLVETEFPLDSTAIHAALRSLEYRELIGGTPLHVTSGLMQTWLLDNVRQSQPARRAPTAAATAHRPWWLIGAALVVLAIVVLVILSIVQMPQGAAQFTPQPTVTLVTTPAQP